MDCLHLNQDTIFQSLEVLVAMIPILLILGLYMFAESLINNGKINIKAILLLITHTLYLVYLIVEEKALLLFL